jgi:excisionase family DNA binding protein
MITMSSTAKKEPIPPLVRFREVAQLLSVSRCTVRALIESGDLTASEVDASRNKLRRHRRVTRKSLSSFTRSGLAIR